MDAAPAGTPHGRGGAAVRKTHSARGQEHHLVLRDGAEDPGPAVRAAALPRARAGPGGAGPRGRADLRANPGADLDGIGDRGLDDPAHAADAGPADVDRRLVEGP